MIALFSIEPNKSIIANALAGFDRTIGLSDFEQNRNNFILLVLDLIKGAPEHWDNNCQINIKWIGDQFIRRVSSVSKSSSKADIDLIGSACFRFALELYLSTQSIFDPDLDAARNRIFENVDNFEPEAQSQLKYAMNAMPIAILKQVVNSNEITSLKEFNQTIERAKQLKAEWDGDIDKKSRAVEQLKSSLEKYEMGFNFVGLFQGFDEMSRQKQEECKGILFWLRILSAVIILIPVAEIAVIAFNYKHIETISSVLIASILPTITMIATCVYYFRVLLFNHKATKSQLLQIELRKTLCRFIQSYSVYASEINKTAPEALAKFESIIFSGIISDEEKLPSTYDGLEQISNLIKGLRS